MEDRSLFFLHVRANGNIWMEDSSKSTDDERKIVKTKLELSLQRKCGEPFQINDRQYKIICPPIWTGTVHIDRPVRRSHLEWEEDSTCIEQQCSSTPSRDANNYPKERVMQKNTLMLSYVYIIRNNSIITTTVSTTMSIQLRFPPDFCISSFVFCVTKLKLLVAVSKSSSISSSILGC